jgi:membrane-associated phospholipid phosphatase
MLWRGIDIEPQWVVLALMVIALALGRGKQFIFDFLPFLLLFFAYEVMRGFASHTGFPTHDFSQLERPLFFGQIPTLALQSAFYRPGQIGVLDLVAIGFYFMHFVLPVGVGFLFWLSSREYYWRFVASLLLLCFLAFVTYLFFPSTPPWLQFPHEVHKISDETVGKLGLDYFISPLYRHFDPNLYAAFPSLHAAFPFLAAIYAWPRHRRLALLLIAWTACVWFSIVYLGEHYVVDALAGVVYALVAVAVVERVRRMPAMRAAAEESGGRRALPASGLGQRLRRRLPPDEPNGRRHQDGVAQGDGAEEPQGERHRRP